MITIEIGGGVTIESGISINVLEVVVSDYITTEDNLEIIAENGDNLVT
jgi:hypothetical protein